MDNFTRMRSRITAVIAALMVGAALAVGVAPAQQAQEQASPPAKNANEAAMEKLAQFQQVKLTEEKAKAALEVFLGLQKISLPEVPANPDGLSQEEAKKAAEAVKKVIALLKEKGFSSPEDWEQHFKSLGLAIAFVREGGREGLKKRLEQIEAASMPEEAKVRARIMLMALVPPKQNVEVVKKLLADEKTRKMIEQVEKMSVPQKPAGK